MNAETSAPLVPNELAVAWDTLVAPRTAFAAVRQRPRWLVAYAVTCVLGMVGAFLQTPAGVNIARTQVQKMFATDPTMAAMSPEKQQAVLAQAVGVQHYLWVIYPVIVIVTIALTAAVLLIAKAIGKGDAGYSRLFSLAAHVTIVSFGLAYLYIGILVAFKGGAEFQTQQDLLNTLPSLAWLAPGAAPKLGAFLASFSVFALWSTFLMTIGLEIVARLARSVAASTAVVLLLVSSAVATLAAR